MSTAYISIMSTSPPQRHPRLPDEFSSFCPKIHRKKLILKRHLDFYIAYVASKTLKNFPNLTDLIKFHEFKPNAKKYMALDAAKKSGIFSQGSQKIDAFCAYQVVSAKTGSGLRGSDALLEPWQQ